MEAIASYHDLVRKDALAILPEKVGRVLDFGGGVGATAASLRDSGRAHHAVLFDQVADQALPQIDAAEALDFEDIAAMTARTLAHGPFDTILALDILEHLRDPWAVSEVLAGALKPGGRLLVSVPNLSSYEILTPLLLRNSFAYAHAGLLDRTHLRWFTRPSAIELATGGQLGIEKVGTNFFAKRQIAFNVLTLGVFKRFITQQWLIMAKKPG